MVERAARAKKAEKAARPLSLQPAQQTEKAACPFSRASCSPPSEMKGQRATALPLVRKGRAAVQFVLI
ncbi:hypothetical protein TIFTF001_026991 [Ficus carica]|uniref:Uncharacterized protein n=1 Tax=Ficus carica TaxID=3494 RepID=A0AA88DM58_FICCA|nr:hypothetical protein TIFTF001_026991 [Ficus carica]